VAVGLSNKCIKYYELQEYSMVSTTTIDSMVPREMCFNNTGEACFVAYDECTKIYNLESEGGKPILLDVIAKPCRQVMDLKLSKDSKHLYCLDSSNFLGNAGGDPSSV